MTLSPWLVYLWGITDGIKGMFGAVAATCGIFIVATAIFGPVLQAEMDWETSTLFKIVKRLVLALIFSGLLHAIIPSSKTVAIMVIAPAIVNSDPIQKDLPEIYNAAVDALKEQLKK